MEKMAYLKIENLILKMSQNTANRFYKYIMVDLDDKTIIVTRFGMKVKKMLRDARITEVPVMYAFSSLPSETVDLNC